MGNFNRDDIQGQKFGIDQLFYRNPSVLTLTGNLTIPANGPSVWLLDPGGASRTLTMPAEANVEDKIFVFHNIADAAENLVINDDASALLAVVPRAGVVELLCSKSTWRVLNFSPGFASFNPTAVSATLMAPLGTRAVQNGVEYVAVEADANVAVKAWCAIHSDFGIDPLDTDDATTIEVGKELGICVAALTAASTKYGWLAIKGHGLTGLSADATAGVRLQATSTAGTVDDVAGALTGILKGAALEAAVTGGAGEGSFTLNYPFVDTDINA